MGKYFGTDGFRGVANIELTSMHAYRIGRYLGWYLSQYKEEKRPRVVIGKDTRLSSYMLEYSVTAGLCASGADAYMLHVTTTPSVSYITRNEGFDAGIMITASHNPFTDNGIKILNADGEKADESLLNLIEEYIDGGDIPYATGNSIGRITDYVAGRNRYIGHLISIPSSSYKKLRIGLDAANGAAFEIARSVFSSLSAHVEMIGDSPNGLNINDNCGSTHIDALQKLVKARGLDAGFAFDGDADRCIAIDENGDVVDGDGIMYILASRLMALGALNKKTVVATVMSNSGFVKSLSELGINTSLTTVGDRYVFERMTDGEYSLGGEQSGHIIVKKYSQTGDGIITALLLCEQMCESNKRLSELYKGLTLYPQFTENVRVRDKDAAICASVVAESLESARRAIGNNGRILLRKSGTEQLLRVMVECESHELAKHYANLIKEAIEKYDEIN